MDRTSPTTCGQALASGWVIGFHGADVTRSIPPTTTSWIARTQTVAPALRHRHRHCRRLKAYSVNTTAAMLTKDGFEVQVCIGDVPVTEYTRGPQDGDADVACAAAPGPTETFVECNLDTPVSYNVKCVWRSMAVATRRRCGL